MRWASQLRVFPKIEHNSSSKCSSPWPYRETQSGLWHRLVFKHLHTHIFIFLYACSKVACNSRKNLVTKIPFLCVHSERLCSAGKKPVSHTILFLNTWLFSFNKVTCFHHNSAIFPLGWVPLDLKIKIYVTLAFLLTLRGVFHLHHAINLWVILWIMQMGIPSSALLYFWKIYQEATLLRLFWFYVLSQLVFLWFLSTSRTFAFATSSFLVYCVFEVSSKWMAFPSSFIYRIRIMVAIHLSDQSPVKYN